MPWSAETCAHQTSDNRLTGHAVPFASHGSPRSFRSFSHRLPPRRRRAHGALQLAVRAAHGGVFVLRIEDTDLERSSDEMVGRDPRRAALARPRLGRRPRHRRRVRSRTFSPSASIVIARWRERLVAGGHAYYCYCTPEALKAKREAAEQAGRAWRYDRTCCRADAATRSPRASAIGLPRAVRFRVPEGATRFDDLVHGPIEFDGANIEDFVLLRSDGQPDLSAVRRVRRHRDEDHARGARRRSHLEHAEADSAVSRGRRAGAEVRARAADSRPRQETAEQAPRRDVGDRVRDAGLSAGGDVQFPLAARLVAGKRR